MLCQVGDWAWKGSEEELKGTIVQRGDRRINAEVRASTSRRINLASERQPPCEHALFHRTKHASNQGLAPRARQVSQMGSVD